MTNTTRNRLRFLIAILAVVALSIFCSQFAHAQDATEIEGALAVLQRHVTYEPGSSNLTALRPPVATIKAGRGNCLEQSFALCYMILVLNPDAICEIGVYTNGPGTVGHATAIINGIEVDPSGGLTGNTYRYRRVEPYSRMLYLYTRNYE